MHRMRYGSLIAGLFIGIVFGSRSSEAQYTANFQTNIISGVTSNWSGNYVVGSNTFADVLVIQGAGILGAGSGHVGYAVSGSNNSVLVTDAGSVWSNRFNLYVGFSGAGNSLVISNGGKVTGYYSAAGSGLHAYEGYNASSSNNNIVVTGTNSSWTIFGDLNLGYSGGGSILIVRDGGKVFNSNGYLGYSSTSNKALVSGAGSVWSNRGGCYVGFNGSGNSLSISNGGRLASSSGGIGLFSQSINNSAVVAGEGSMWLLSDELDIGATGSSNTMMITSGGKVVDDHGIIGNGNAPPGVSNSVLVTGSGSVWSNSAYLHVGLLSSSSTLVISNDGQVVSYYGYVGFGSGSTRNTVRITEGASWWNNTLHVGEQGSSNLLVVVGGTVFAESLTIGVASSSCDNLVQLDSGTVVITNATSHATLEVRRGKLILNGGTIQVDRFVMTNACAQFVRTGGTLIYGVATLDPNRDDDGDGIFNGWEQSHGLDPLNAADANADSDGDGFTNLQEYLAGTNPTNSASAFRITSLVETDHDLLVTWTMGAGKTNALLAAAGSDGNYTNGFADIFTVTNTTGTVTNYLDIGAATNVPGRFYRVRLVP